MKSLLKERCTYFLPYSGEVLKKTQYDLILGQTQPCIADAKWQRGGGPTAGDQNQIATTFVVRCPDPLADASQAGTLFSNYIAPLWRDVVTGPEGLVLL